MKRVLVLSISLVMILGAVAFAGPFFGADYVNGGTLDTYFGVSGDVLSGEVTFTDILAVNPSVAINISAGVENDNVDVTFGFDASVIPASVWALDEIMFSTDSVIDIGVLFDTDWTIELNANLGVGYRAANVGGVFQFAPALDWGVGFRVEIPWAIQLVQAGSTSL